MNDGRHVRERLEFWLTCGEGNRALVIERDGSYFCASATVGGVVYEKTMPIENIINAEASLVAMLDYKKP